MQDVSHEVLEKGFEDVRFVHSGVAMFTGDTAPDVEKRTDHGCLGEGDCIFDGWLAVVATFNLVGGGDGKEESEEMADLENFHCRYGSRSISVESEHEKKPRPSTIETGDRGT